MLTRGHMATVLAAALLFCCATRCHSKTVRNRCLSANDAADAGPKLSVSDRLTPLDSRLAPGNEFDKELFSKLLSQGSSTNITWFKVPNFSVGNWKHSQTNRISRRDEKTGVEQLNSPSTFYDASREEWGHMRDSRGDVWHRVDRNYWTKGKLKDLDTYGFVRSLEPVYLSDKSMILKTCDVGFKVDSATNKIKSCVQSETVTQLKPVGDGSVRGKQLQKVFDMQGNPDYSVTDIIEYTVKSPFKEFRPDNSLDVQLQAQLKAFLRANGMEF